MRITPKRRRQQEGVAMAVAVALVFLGLSLDQLKVTILGLSTLLFQARLQVASEQQTSA